MIDEQIIREKAAELERMMQRLEEFRKTDFTREICNTCQWQRVEVLAEFGQTTYVRYVCIKCGLEQTRELKWVGSSEEDPWADMRPDGGEEE